MTKPEIIKTIRRLHRQGEPLNILAVKRRHPELIQAVYAVKPFWGWKQALQDAGIKYSKIKIELQEYITCEICGKPMRNLANHVILKHEVKADEYLMDYPDSELQSETLRAEKTIGKNIALSHWEPCWSREYVLDRVAEYHRRGYPMHIGKFRGIDNSLIMAALRYLGGWNEVLIAVGFDPRKLTEKAYQQLHIYPDQNAVIRGIKQRLKKALPVHSSALHKKDEGNRTHASLLISGKKLFGSWNNALKAAGVDPELMRQALRQKRKYATKQDVIRGIRARYKRKWAINFADLYHGKNQDGNLARRACEYFRSWNNALKAAGFDPVKIHQQVILKNRRYPDKKSVLQDMKRRNKTGRFMNHNSLFLGPDRDIPLLRWAKKFFGSWNYALKKIGLDPSKIKADACARGVRKCRLGMMKTGRWRMRR